MTSASEIVESYQAALGKGDIATARKLMQDNMTFQGPLDTFNKADEYLEALKRLASIIQRIDLKKVFVDGDDVCVLYDMVTNTPAGTAFIAEWYQVKDGKIATLRAVFDARSEKLRVDDPRNDRAQRCGLEFVVARAQRRQIRGSAQPD